MGFLDIILCALLVFAFYKGVINGLFVELASLISLLLGIYFAIKFSFIMKEILMGFVKWNPNTIQIVAFALTFIVVVIGIHLLGKFLTGIANFAFLGWLNKLGGGFFRVLKTVLIVSIVFSVFEKINYNNFLAKKETLDNSIFFNPIQKIAVFVFPSIKKGYDEMKKKV
ncbi:MAG TPA: CvpA family protein [Flavobacterium sp.]|jgi:membrane protein required for colicin V production|uniref:CvpA family protein n=1 Tax=Flavobacterium sp. TaxID=239 RepID=UPI001B564094|nr:CvpA family protein [Flavobacterium sp.]MBP7182980.1 CvpA family protein [Flavobacterium sp.]MBP7318111.1 CvpA family protein [Flavobacterium sp.]MBP8886487.1 CvpA family protein [Flavobacterium sp.]HRL71993.1 CvpA family protein [Flavobacterium sp.]HRM47002.1 CvpA family protein [Flavobacterium sp.]